MKLKSKSWKLFENAGEINVLAGYPAQYPQAAGAPGYGAAYPYPAQQQNPNPGLPPPPGAPVPVHKVLPSFFSL